MEYEFIKAPSPLASFNHSHAVKELCQGCPKHAKNFACPHFSPYFTDYIEGTREATVMAVRVMPQKKGGETFDEAARRTFTEARELLVKELLQKRGEGYIVCGSGYCMECEVCAAASGGEECILPEKMVYSLESLGVNVGELAKESLNISLEWADKDGGPTYIHAIGAIFR